LAVLLAWSVVLLVPGVASAQGDGVGFVVQPSAGSSTAPHGGYFLVAAEPGEVLTQSVDIRNDSSERLELQLAAVDAVTGQLGGASYSLGAEEATRIGAWIELSRTSLSLEPGASAVVPFTITVPAGTGPGEHLAGISVSPPTDRSAQGAVEGGQAGAAIDVRTRRVVAVQVNLPGAAIPHLVIHGVSASARSDGLYLEIGVEHTGTALTKASGVITLPDDDFTREFSIDTFVPGTSIAYPIKWTPDAAGGEHPVQVKVRYGDDVARWEGTFTNLVQVRDELADRQVGGSGATGPGAIPAGVLMGLVGAAGALVVLAVLAVRRPRSRASHHRAARQQGRLRALPRHSTMVTATRVRRHRVDGLHHAHASWPSAHEMSPAQHLQHHL